MVRWLVASALALFTEEQSAMTYAKESQQPAGSYLRRSEPEVFFHVVLHAETSETAGTRAYWQGPVAKVDEQPGDPRAGSLEYELTRPAGWLHGPTA